MTNTEMDCAAKLIRVLCDAPESVRLNALATACRVFIENRLPQPPNPPVIVGPNLVPDSEEGGR